MIAMAFNLSDITFDWVWAFFLLPLPLLVWLLSSNKNHQAADGDHPQLNPNYGALKVPFFQQLANKVGTVRQNIEDKPKPKANNWWKWLLLTLSWLLLVTAVSRPNLMGEKIPLPMAGRDIMMAVDLSGSMAAEDLSVIGNRLDVVKATANQFIGRRVGDRIGLIFFSDRAYLQSPLTFDRTVVQSLLDEAQVGLTGQRTAIGDAMAIGLKRLRETQAQVVEDDLQQNTQVTDNNVETKSAANDVDNKDSRVLILLTDGANNAGVTSPEKATEIAQKLGIKVYTIGVGGEPRVVDGFFGRRLQVTSDLDESALQNIAEQTGGQYFRATDMNELEAIYQAIDELEPINRDPKFLYPQVTLYHYPAIGSLLSFMLLIMLSGIGLYRRNRQQIKEDKALPQPSKQPSISGQEVS